MDAPLAFAYTAYAQGRPWYCRQTLSGTVAYWCPWGRGTAYLSQQLGDDCSEGGARHHHPPGRGRGRGEVDSGLDLRVGRPEGGSRVRLYSKMT